MDRFIDGDHAHFDESDAFERVMETFWSEHDWGDDFDHKAFEDAVFDAIAADVWERAEDDVCEAHREMKASRRDPYGYRGVRQSDFL
jgi:hypothetical protein